jgi:hypothetical protein
LAGRVGLVGAPAQRDGRDPAKGLDGEMVWPQIAMGKGTGTGAARQDRMFHTMFTQIRLRLWRDMSMRPRTRDANSSSGGLGLDVLGADCVETKLLQRGFVARRPHWFRVDALMVLSRFEAGRQQRLAA